MSLCFTIVLYFLAMSKAINNKTSPSRYLTLLASWCRGHSFRESEVQYLQYGGLIVLVLSLLSLLFPQYMPCYWTIFKTTISRNSITYFLYLMIIQWMMITRFNWLKHFASLTFFTWLLLDFFLMIYSKGVLQILYYCISMIIFWLFIWMLWKLLQGVISRCFIYDVDKEGNLRVDM